MVGGPSQLDLFDYKPRLQELDGQPIPNSFLKGKRFAFMDFFTKEKPRLLGSQRRFECYGKSGKTVSECLPHTASVVGRSGIRLHGGDGQLQPCSGPRSSPTPAPLDPDGPAWEPG